MHLLDKLKSIVGENGFLSAEEVAKRSAGWASVHNMTALALVRPKTTEQVSQILRACHEAGQPVVPHGGLTGLVDGTLSGPHEIILSLESMNKIEDLDIDGGVMTVQAGAILQAVQQKAAASDLTFPMDLGARGSATIGGLIAANAGGNNVIRYGMTRNLVLGLEAVLADGTIVSSMRPLLKNNSGYDLKHLFIGSEGTLGVVTRAVLRLVPQSRSQVTAFVAMNEFAQAPKLLRRVSAGLGGTLSSFEIMWNEFYRLVSTPPAAQQPILPQTFPFYALIDARGSDPAADQRRFENLLLECHDEGLIADSVVAMSAPERKSIWALRDDVEQFRRFNPRFNFDISLPIRCMEAYVETVREKIRAEWPDHRCFVFGHMGDCNLHITIYNGIPESRHRAEEIVYGSLPLDVASVSAEHGIGLEKRDWLKLCRTPEELSLMRTMKRALDPKGILNPGKIVEV